jgi:hypothetical protein
MVISKYAHSIKNPSIIHLIRNKRYVCFSCCSTTPSKSTTNPLKVTCKNCKRYILNYLAKKCMIAYKKLPSHTSFSHGDLK